jgi:hypothetical protein
MVVAEYARLKPIFRSDLRLDNHFPPLCPCPALRASATWNCATMEVDARLRAQVAHRPL